MIIIRKKYIKLVYNPPNTKKLQEHFLASMFSLNWSWKSYPFVQGRSVVAGDLFKHTLPAGW